MRPDARAPRLPPASLAILLAIAVFVGLELVAMHLYPGGTWWDRGARGYRFWQNYICDLEWRVTLDGRPNLLGSRLAEAAMLALILGFVPFWWIVPRLFWERRRLGRAVSVLGTVSVAGMVAVALMPSERFGVLHGVVVVVAGVPGLTAAVLATVALLRSEPRPPVVGPLGAAMLVFAVLDFLLYVRTIASGGPGPILLPAIQKVALLLLLAWMAAVAVRARTLELRR